MSRDVKLTLGDGSEMMLNLTDDELTEFLLAWGSGQAAIGNYNRDLDNQIWVRADQIVTVEYSATRAARWGDQVPPPVAGFN